MLIILEVYKKIYMKYDLIKIFKYLFFYIIEREKNQK